MRALLAIMLGAGLAVPAVAQDRDIERERDRFLRPQTVVGSNLKQEPETASEADAREMQKRLAKCIYYGNRKELDTLLANSDFDRIDFSATEYDSENFFDEIDFSRCLGRAMKHSQYKVYATMRYSTLRNLLAEEAYLYQNKDAPVREEGAPTLIEARFANVRRNPRSQVLAEVADCISYRDTAGAHAFLETTPGSGKETDALENLYPTLLTCMETDKAPDLSRSLVRQMVADGMWSRSHHGGFAAATTNPAEAE